MATRGDITEGVVLGELVKAELSILVPFRHDLPYDLLVHLPDDRFVKVQCKAGRLRDGCVIFNSASTDHGRGARHYRGRADVFGVFCPQLDAVYMVPVDEAATSATWLRVEPSRNGQRLRVRHAEHYTVARWLARVLDGAEG